MEDLAGNRNNKTPKLTVVVPIYNSEKYIKRALDSIVDQTIFDELEVILVDDGSIDDSKEIYTQFVKEHENIMVIQKENGGVSSARNAGIKEATGEYICFIDSDDTINADYCEYIYRSIIVSDVDIVCVNTNCYSGDKMATINKNKKRELVNGKDELLKKFFMGGTVTNSPFSKIFKTQQVKAIGFAEGKRIGEDMFFVYQYLARCEKALLDYGYAGYNYYKNDGSAMNSCFSKKFFDVIELSKRIVRQESNSNLREYARAHYVQDVLQVIKYLITSPNREEFCENESELVAEIKRYSILRALKYMQRNRFCDFALMRLSRKLYRLLYMSLRVRN